MGLIKMSAKTARKAAAVHDGLDRQALYDGPPFERMYMTSFLQALIDRGLDVHAVPVSGGWVEIDSPSDLRIEFVE
jgi:NDP-sugar pyrophosphorylase family protein